MRLEIGFSVRNGKHGGGELATGNPTEGKNAPEGGKKRTNVFRGVKETASFMRKESSREESNLLDS